MRANDDIFGLGSARLFLKLDDEKALGLTFAQRRAILRPHRKKAGPVR